MPLVDELAQANAPAVRLLKAKLAHAFPKDRLCPMRKELTSQQPNAPASYLSTDMTGPFIHVVFNFQSWEMFEFASPPPETEGAPVISAGENIKLYFMDPVGRLVMHALKSQRLHCETILKDLSTTLQGATFETIKPCLEEDQTPAFYLLQLLLAENILGQQVDSSDLMLRFVQSETVVLLAKEIVEC